MCTSLPLAHIMFYIHPPTSYLESNQHSLPPN